jgi:hypothetical protein
MDYINKHKWLQREIFKAWSSTLENPPFHLRKMDTQNKEKSPSNNGKLSISGHVCVVDECVSVQKYICKRGVQFPMCTQECDRGSMEKIAKPYLLNS